MSRIRTVKPEFWVSEQITQCCHGARLLFIGMWNFCDDNGVHPAKPKTLRAEVFPMDEVTVHDIEKWVGELISAGLLLAFEADGQGYWHVTGWKKHQKIDRPSCRYPPPPGVNTSSGRGEFDESSPKSRRTLDVPSTSATPRNGMESKGGEGNGVDVPSPDGEGPAEPAAADFGASAPAKTSGPYGPNCPHQGIIDLYHHILPAAPRVKDWHAARQKALAARWREDPKRQTLDWWRKYLEYVSRCDFLMGRTEPRHGRPPFMVDLEWLVKRSNFTKVIEGKYDNTDAEVARAA